MEIKTIAPGIVVCENFIENPKKIIDAAFEREKIEGSREAGVVKEDQTIIEKNMRDTKVIDISTSFSHDVFWWTLAQKIWSFGDMYAKNYNIAFSYMENLQFLHYYKNQGFYNIHSDVAPGLPRIFSAVLYLNNVESGGETYFNNFDLSVSPIAGRLIMFPANFAYSHGAKVPESEDKYAIVTWFS
jgi:hypothetical protein